ncbi:MAG: HypC/HybG/HupF family hydrogenase formation chaperone [Ignavibacteriaceae bacterium]
MCLAIPGKIVSIDENPGALKMAKADFAGVTKNICVDWLPDVKIGEYVLVHVGFALNKIDEQQAEETLQALREMGEIIEDELKSDEEVINDQRKKEDDAFK